MVADLNWLDYCYNYIVIKYHPRERGGEGEEWEGGGWEGESEDRVSDYYYGFLCSRTSSFACCSVQTS